VTSDVKVGYLEPEIKIDVVLLTALEGLVLLASGASHDQELVVQAADTVAMARILHVIHLDTIEYTSSVLHNLVALLESRWLALDIATTDKEELVGRSLHVCEVVLEVKRDIHSSAEHLLLDQVILEYGLRVALKNENRL